MRYELLLKVSGALLLSGPLAACAPTLVRSGVPACERLIPAMLVAPVPPVPLPETREHSDGHEDALPWMEGFIGQTGQLDKANERAPAVDHIYRNCLELHREALRRDTRGFFGRLFGG
jgi:hypothetical protein